MKVVMRVEVSDAAANALKCYMKGKAVKGKVSRAELKGVVAQAIWDAAANGSLKSGANVGELLLNVK